MQIVTQVIHASGAEAVGTVRSPQIALESTSGIEACVTVSAGGTATVTMVYEYSFDGSVWIAAATTGVGTTDAVAVGAAGVILRARATVPLGRYCRFAFTVANEAATFQGIALRLPLC